MCKLTYFLADTSKKDALFANYHSGLLNFLPINKPLSLVVEFNGKGYNLTLVGLERLGISVVNNLFLCSGYASILCEFQFYNILLLSGKTFSNKIN